MRAAVFPGQGSQRPGMGRELAANHREARLIFEEVSQAAGVNVEKLCWNSLEVVLRETQNAQLALFTCGVAAWTVLESRGDDPVSVVAGHSVGEYAALVAAKALSVSDGAKLVKIRGELMAKAGAATAGSMAAVLGLDRDLLEQACKDAGGQVVIANDNCPGQLVISGETAALERASKVATEAGAKRVIPLNVSGAFHSPLMAGAARDMGRALSEFWFDKPSLTIYSNVTGEPAQEPGAWPGLLERQLQTPVRWTESVQHMIRDGVTHFIECGVGEVLSGLIRRIDRSVETSQRG